MANTCVAIERERHTSYTPLVFNWDVVFPTQGSDGKKLVDMTNTIWTDLSQRLEGWKLLDTLSAEGDYVSLPPKKTFKVAVQVRHIGRGQPIPFRPED